MLWTYDSWQSKIYDNNIEFHMSLENLWIEICEVYNLHFSDHHSSSSGASWGGTPRSLKWSSGWIFVQKKISDCIRAICYLIGSGVSSHKIEFHKIETRVFHKIETIDKSLHKIEIPDLVKFSLSSLIL